MNCQTTGGDDTVSPADQENRTPGEDSGLPPSSSHSKQLAVECARLADKFKGLDIVVLDMAPLIEITDYFVIVTGTNRRQIRAIGEEIVTRMKKLGLHRTNMDGMESGVWVLADFGTVVLHILNEDARAYYDLDGFWADADRVDWEKEPGFEDPAA